MVCRLASPCGRGLSNFVTEYIGTAVVGESNKYTSCRRKTVRRSVSSENSLNATCTGCAKKVTLVNYVNIMSYKLKDTRYLHRLDNFNIHYY